MSTVRYKQDELPQMTEERKAELKALAERPDSEIDYSDIPPLDGFVAQPALTADGRAVK